MNRAPWMKLYEWSILDAPPYNSSSVISNSSIAVCQSEVRTCRHRDLHIWQETPHTSFSFIISDSNVAVSQSEVHMPTQRPIHIKRDLQAKTTRPSSMNSSCTGNAICMKRIQFLFIHKKRSCSALQWLKVKRNRAWQFLFIHTFFFKKTFFLCVYEKTKLFSSYAEAPFHMHAMEPCLLLQNLNE